MADAKYQNDQLLVAKGIDRPPVPDAKTIMAVCHGFDTRTIAWRHGQPEKGSLAPCRRCARAEVMPGADLPLLRGS